FASRSSAAVTGPHMSAMSPIPNSTAFNERPENTQRMSTNASLQAFIEQHERLFILTGAGCSTPSGIPDYRDADGQWKRAQPVTYQAFMGEEKTRRRYWARSLIGWRLIREAQPNDAHRALAMLEARGRTELLLTQNVDR